MTRHRGRWSRVVLRGLHRGRGLFIAPTVSPVFVAGGLVRYKGHRVSNRRGREQQTGPCRAFADEFGWGGHGQGVARVSHELPPRADAASTRSLNIYGQGARLISSEKKYGLPKAISNSLKSYWLWGPRDYRAKSVIVLGSDGSGDSRALYARRCGRAYLPSLLTARRALRYFSLPRPEHDAADALAGNQKMGLTL